MTRCDVIRSIAAAISSKSFSDGIPLQDIIVDEIGNDQIVGWGFPAFGEEERSENMLPRRTFTGISYYIDTNREPVQTI